MMVHLRPGDLYRNAHGHVLLRLLGFLRGGGYGIEADECEEYFTRAAQHAAEAELAGQLRYRAE